MAANLIHLSFELPEIEYKDFQHILSELKKIEQPLGNIIYGALNDYLLKKE